MDMSKVKASLARFDAHTSDEYVKTFRDRGYVYGMPVFSSDEVDEINSELQNILALLEPGESTKEIREWHEESRFLYDLCMERRILDCVEPLLGPDFYMWASNFFIKQPQTLETVGWHQDAYYWPLKPVESLTVWLALDDVDEENGAMQVLPGSHKSKIVPHLREASDSVLGLVADVTSFDLSEVRSVRLNRGEISIHDDKLLHCSPANPSDRRRAGFTIRFSPNQVKCDLNVNPHFRIYQARGQQCTHNPIGELPKQRYGRLWREHKSIEEAGDEKNFWKKDEA
jgi:ectoine hydroxylase-related dioxygenase (phytanoyl-CoA dioxygenase family)